MATYTISNILTGPITLPHPIDNSKGSKKIAIKYITVWIGWYNIFIYSKMSIRNRELEHKDSSDTGITPDYDITAEIYPGLRNVNDIKALFDRAGSFLKNEAGDVVFTPISDTMIVDRGSGLVLLTAIEDHQITIDGNILNLLGIGDVPWYSQPALLLAAGSQFGHLSDTVYTDIAQGTSNMWPKCIDINLKQLSINSNILDGKYSTILNKISPPVGVFGESFTINYESPIYKELATGFITELDFEVIIPNFPSRGETYNSFFNNHGQPISVKLEII